MPALTVAENVFLGTEPRRAGFVRRRALRRRYAELASGCGFDLGGDQNAGGLRIADQQKVEILRALARDARLIVMDEPTAALARPDVDRLHEIIRGWPRPARRWCWSRTSSGGARASGRGDDPARRPPGPHGRGGGLRPMESLLSAMLGRSLGATFPARRPAPPDAPVVLSVRGLTAPGVTDVSLDIRAGEIVGLAGLVGAGRTELARAVYRAHRAAAGTVTAAGGRRSPAGTGREARAARCARRGHDPRVAPGSGAPAAALGHGERQPGQPQAGQPGRDRPAGGRAARRRPGAEPAQRAHPQPGRAGRRTLSGGNQQKLLFARMLLGQPQVLIADEPTRGVDVGAKRAIYELLTSLAADGLGVLLISSDVEEILGLAHRVLVMRSGRIAAELGTDDITEEAVLGAAFGAAGGGTA